MRRRRVLLLGATGLVGSELLDLLLDDATVESVTALVRRPTGRSDTHLDERVLSLDEMASASDVFDVDDVFCALGTTIAKAGSQKQFRVVDHDYPLEAARRAHESGATHLLLVSALGANARSRVFYNRVKGELESAIVAIGFRSVSIARPSLLLGERAEHRRGEELAKRFAFLTPARYKPIEARAVAAALVAAARDPQPGVRILESREMREAFAAGA